jgi:cytochrome P450
MGSGGGVKYPPGPRGLETFGFLGRGSAARALAFLEQTARSFGPISSFSILGRRVFLIDDPALIEDVLVTRQHQFVRDTGATLLCELLGDGLLTSDEPRHRERRRLLQPAFHREQVATYAVSMVAESERMGREWEGRATIDIRTEMRKLTLSIVGACLFGADFRESTEQIAAVLRRVVRRIALLGPAFLFLEPAALLYRRLFPRGPSLVFRADRAELECIIKPIVQQRRGSNMADLLSILLRLRDDSDAPLTEEDVCNEAVTLVLAGNETTAAALTWTWFLISHHPAVEQRFHTELDMVLGDYCPGFDDIAKLRYTSMILQEAMRLYPPALAFGRRPIEPVELGGYTIPAGTSILLSPYVTHRNERWFKDPEVFDPTRWENASVPKFAYFPFGGGAKMCIGEPFARMEAILAIATLGKAWSLRAVDKSPVGPAPGIALRPKGNIDMRPTKRGPAPR